MINPEQLDSGPPGLHPQRDNVHESRHVQGQAWSYGFLRECLIPVVNHCLAIKQPKYTEILKLDKSIRNSILPNYIQIPLHEEVGLNAYSKAGVMQQFSAGTVKEMCKDFPLL